MTYYSREHYTVVTDSIKGYAKRRLRVSCKVIACLEGRDRGRILRVEDCLSWGENDIYIYERYVIHVFSKRSVFFNNLCRGEFV